MNANPIILQKKYARIIALYAKKYEVATELAFDRFYTSKLYILIREGVSDMHCMSDEYLTESLHEEFPED